MRSLYTTNLTMNSPHVRTIILSLLTAVLFCISAVASFLYASYRQVLVTPVVSPTVSVESSPSPDPLRPYSVLLLGYGGGNHAGGRLTDTIMVARVNPRTEEIHLISIPRDV